MPQDLMMELGEAAFNQVVNKYMSMKGVKPTGENRNRTVDYLYSNPERVREIASELELLVEADDGKGGKEMKVKGVEPEDDPYNIKKGYTDDEKEEAAGRK